MYQLEEKANSEHNNPHAQAMYQKVGVSSGRV